MASSSIIDDELVDLPDNHVLSMSPSLPSALWRDAILAYVADRSSWNHCVATHQELYEATQRSDRPWPSLLTLDFGHVDSKEDEAFDSLEQITTSTRPTHPQQRTSTLKLFFSRTGRHFIAWSKDSKAQTPVLAWDRIQGPLRLFDRHDKEQSWRPRDMAVSPTQYTIMVATSSQVDVNDDSGNHATTTLPSTDTMLQLKSLGVKNTNRDWDEKALAYSPDGHYLVSVAFKRRRPGRRRGGEVCLRIWKAHQPHAWIQTVVWQGRPNVYEFGPQDDWNLQCCSNNNGSAPWKVVLEYSSELNHADQQRRLFVWKPLLEETCSNITPIVPSYMGLHGKLLAKCANGRYIAIAQLRQQPQISFQLQVLDAHRRFAVIQTFPGISCEPLLDDDDTLPPELPGIHVAFTCDSRYVVVAHYEETTVAVSGTTEAATSFDGAERAMVTNPAQQQGYFQVDIFPLPPLSSSLSTRHSSSSSTASSSNNKPITILRGPCHSIEAMTIGNDARQEGPHPPLGVLALAYRNEAHTPTVQLQIVDLHVALAAAKAKRESAVL